MDRTRLSATVNNVEVSLADGQNVLLVDGADTQDRPSVKAIRADLSSPNTGLIEELATSTLAQIFRRSAEIVSFLQCDASANQALPIPGLPAEYAASIYVCEDLKAK